MHIKITSCQGRRIKLSDKYCSDIPGVAMGEYVVDTVYQRGSSVDNRFNINYGDYAAFSLQMQCLIAAVQYTRML